jgi:hypothetical protein
MKSSIHHQLSSAVAFFALCASAVACGPGGGYRTNQSYPTYPTNNAYPQSYSNAGTSPVSPVSSAPQGHITVVSSTSDAPTGQLQIASPGVSDSSAQSTIHVLPSTTSTTDVAKVDSTDLKKSLDSLNASKEDTSKLPDAIKGLTGTWLAVSRQGDGELSTVELQLDDHGWAKLTVPGTDGKPSTTTRKVELENNEIKLTGADTDVMLGKLVDFNSRQMVLERSGGQVTFVRP